MMIASVMGPERPERTSWNMSGRRRSEPRDRSDDPRDPGGSGDPGERSPPPEVPPGFQPEDDLALARMLGCAMLVGLGCIVGLIWLIF